MAIELEIRKKSEKNFWHYYSVLNLEYSASDILVDYVGNQVNFTRLNGAFVFDKNGLDVAEIAVYDDTQGGVQEIFITGIQLAERLVDLGYNAYFEDAEVISGNSLRTQHLRWAVGGANTASTTWQKYGTAINSINDKFTVTPFTGLTDGDNFAAYPIQTPCWITTFKCKVKNVSIRGFSNSGVASQPVECLKTLSIIGSSPYDVSISGVKITSPVIMAQGSWDNRSPQSNCFNYTFSASEVFDSVTIPKGGEVRFAINNNNVATNFLSSTLVVELEEVL